MNKRDLKKMSIYRLALLAEKRLTKSCVVPVDNGVELHINGNVIFVERDSDYCVLLDVGKEYYELMLKASREYLRKKLIKIISNGKGRVEESCT